MTQYSDQNIQNPVFNLISKSTYEAQTELNEDELYFVDPEFEGNKVLISNGSGDLAESSTSTTELSYLSGVTSNIQTQLNSKQASGNYVSYTNNTVTVAGTSKTVSKTSPEALFVPNGLVMGGTAQAAGLVTRGICGIGTPINTGACDKDNLYLNYDGDGTYRANRQVVLQAGEVGTHYGNNLYQYAAARGDAVKNYADATYAAKSHTHDYVPTARTVNSKALSANITLNYSDVGAAASSHTHTSSEVTDLSTAISSAISGKADSATSLSGYGITDAYTKTEIDGKLSGAMHFKGTKASVSNLPTTGNVQGDMWNVTDTGANYAWDGTAWDKLSENIDLSGYVPTSRTVNGKALSGNISLTASDVGAAASGHTHSTFVKSGTGAAAGFVPAPSTTAGTSKYLCEDGTWVVPPGTYTHPTTSGNKHIPSGGSSGQILKWSADGTATWAAEYSYTHPTTSGNKHIPSGGSSGQILKWSADGTATWANEYSYTHPTTSGNKHIPSGGSSGQILRWSSDGTATWGAEYSYTHPTTSGNKHIPSGGSSGQFLKWSADGTATWAADNDTKNTAGTTNKTGTKMYLAAATSQDTNPQTFSNSGCYIGTDNCLYSNGTKVLTAHQDISGKENTSNKVTSLSSSSTDAQYPSAKCVYDALQNAGSSISITYDL